MEWGGRAKRITERCGGKRFRCGAGIALAYGLGRAVTNGAAHKRKARKEMYAVTLAKPVHRARSTVAGGNDETHEQAGR